MPKATTATGTALTAAQQRHTLSAKKKPKRASLKNVLAQPYTRYWPLITPDEAKHLIASLNAVRPQQFADLNSMWKSPFCTIGLNSTLRRLNAAVGDNSSSSCSSQPTRICDLLLLAADIRPKFIIEQIILLAIGHNPHVRCLLVPDLQRLLSPTDILGTPSCMCVSFVNCAAEAAFDQAYALADNLVRRFPMPATHQRQLLVEQAQPTTVASVTRCVGELKIDEIYVQRVSGVGRPERSFVPAGTTPEPVSNEPVGWSDYISLGGDGPPPQPVAAKRKVNHSAIEEMKRKMKVPGSSSSKPGIISRYVPLTVNRVQGNPNKAKQLNTKTNKP